MATRLSRGDTHLRNRHLRALLPPTRLHSTIFCPHLLVYQIFLFLSVNGMEWWPFGFLLESKDGQAGTYTCGKRKAIMCGT